mmetsp:Transcript_14297/g.33918  ORF Transcript_14297/g.33918 Transcript_14297/m.33918 type:complete len:383 (+) Transcript_14297:67-1215(+)
MAALLRVLSPALLGAAVSAELQAHFLGPDTGYPLARCLDGSPALYYLSPGYDSGKDKHMIFFQGGGYCGSDADCLDRATDSFLGSTSDDDLTINKYESSGTQDGFWRDTNENPLMHNWNHVFVRYCDGGYYSGDLLEPKIVDGKELFYRGKYITEALFKDLAPKLTAATDIVVSGCSAGAMRIYAHLDAMRTMLPSTARVVGYADSGFFMATDAFSAKKEYLVKGHNGTALFNPECVKDHASEPHKCILASVSAAYLKTPLFAFQSRYDFDQLEGETDEACRESEQCVNNYAADLSAKLEEHLVGPHGYFTDSCERHCWWNKGYSGVIPSSGPRDDASGLTNLRAFKTWYEGGTAAYNQAAVPSCVECCHGKSPTRRLDVLV